MVTTISTHHFLRHGVTYHDNDVSIIIKDSHSDTISIYTNTNTNTDTNSNTITTKNNTQLRTITCNSIAPMNYKCDWYINEFMKTFIHIHNSRVMIDMNDMYYCDNYDYYNNYHNNHTNHNSHDSSIGYSKIIDNDRNRNIIEIYFTSLCAYRHLYYVIEVSTPLSQPIEINM
jgi:hypothetical protein